MTDPGQSVNLAESVNAGQINPFDGLVMSVMTTPGALLAERVTAAAAAGYRGIGLRPGDRTKALATGLTDADLRSMLDDHGLSVVEIDVLVGWGLGPDQAGKALRHEQRIHELADALGAHHMTITGDLAGPFDDAVEKFAGVCDRAAEHGLIVALEFLPWTDVPDADTARRIISGAGRPNGGVLVDSWHHFRGAASDDQLLALPVEMIVGVQFDDGMFDMSGPLLDQTFHRELPGEGEFDLTHFLRVLAGIGVTLPICVEVISPAMTALPPAEAALRSAEATRRLLARTFRS